MSDESNWRRYKIYEIYLDIYFIESFVMNITMVIFTLFLMKKKIMLFRLIMGALLGSIGAVVMLLAGIKYGMTYILAVFLCDFVMLMPCLKKNIKELNISDVSTGIVYFHGLAFAYTKLTDCIYGLGISKVSGNITLLILGGAIIFISWYQNNKKTQSIYKVVIRNYEEKIELMSLYDTGNVLQEPISHKPVSVVEENDVINEWIRKYPQRYKIIPYRSIGNENGVLEGTCVDELIICDDNKEKIEKQAIIAVYKGKLSKDNSFKMILNNMLLSS